MKRKSNFIAFTLSMLFTMGALAFSIGKPHYLRHHANSCKQIDHHEKN
ncbi:MAG: hypothetical protein JNM44_04970 [Chitinophagaceae bacterium]|nr:hypothetical protein [Chitinophagaceae bacterium]